MEDGFSFFLGNSPHDGSKKPLEFRGGDVSPSKARGEKQHKMKNGVCDWSSRFPSFPLVVLKFPRYFSRQEGCNAQHRENRSLITSY